MNKFINKIAVAMVGIAMAVGVGVAVGSGKGAKSVYAAETPGSTIISTVSSTTITSDDYFQVSFAQGLATTAPAANASRVRMYANHNTNTTGNTLTVSTKSGVNNKYITGISIAGTNVNNKVNLAFNFSDSPSSTTSTRGTYPHSATWASSSQLTSVTATSTKGSGASQGDITSVTVYYVTVSSDKTIDTFTCEPGNGDTVNLAATSTTSISSDVLYEIAYTDSTKGYDVEISCAQAGFSFEDDREGTATLTFKNNDNYSVVVKADDNHSATITYHVTGLNVDKYELVTDSSKLKSGKKVLIAKSDATLVMGTYAGGNNIPAVSSALDGEDYFFGFNLNENATIFTLGGNATDGWTFGARDKFLHDPNSSGNNYLYVDSTEDTWTISVDSEGIASITNVNSSKALKNNGSLFACYNSGQNDVSIFMLKTNDPEIEVAVTGSTSLSVGGTATLVATKVNGATGTIVWTKGNNHVNLGTPVVDGNTSTVVVTGVTDGSTDVTASLTGGSTVDPVVTSFTVTRALSSIAVTTAPTKTTYTEGQSFDKTGMVITATYDDTSTETPSDYTWSPSGALTPSDTTITISWGGKTTTQAITVNAKTVSSISVKTLPTKSAYHADEVFSSIGLVITVNYSDSTSADITSGFTLSPASYTFTSADEAAGSKTFTVSYGGKSTTFNVTVQGISAPLGNSGRYYIMTSDKGYGLNAAAASSSPDALDLSVSNELTAFDFELVGDSEYKVTVTINETLYYLACTTTAESGSNSSIRVNTTSTTATWHLDNTDVEAAGAYHFYTVPGSVNRYLACYNSDDWRGYNSLSYGDPEIQFVAEGSYANSIADSLNDDLTCDNGEHAPSTSVWSTISSAYANITIAHEKNLLKSAEYTKSGSGYETVVEAAGSTSQNIAEAIAKYDYVVGLYNKGKGIAAYNDYLNRDPSPIGGSGLIHNNMLNNETNAAAVVTIISMTGLAAVGGFFFIRKKKIVK